MYKWPDQMPKKFKTLQLLSLLIVPLWLSGQNLLPSIRNYKMNDYGAANKNWGLAADENGELFVANNEGLLHYNGQDWNLYELPDRTVVRSAAYIKGKVYTGSYEEFGYWEKDDKGILAYTSLTHLIKDHTFTNEEFWQILPYDGRIVFRSFSGVYIYSHEGISVLDPGIVVANIAVYDGRLIVAGNTGFFTLEDGKLVHIMNLGPLDGKTIIDMVAFEEGLLIGTKLNGCYFFREEGFLEWEAPVNANLKSYQLNRMLPLPDKKIAFGTIKNGIYIYDMVTRSSEPLNRETGLQNNTVLALLRFKNQLWAGLDNGIARIPLKAPITYYTDYSGSVGTVYDMAVHEEMLYLGSNTGVYYFEDDTLRFMEGSQGHVWDLEVVDGDLLCGHNTGTYSIADRSLQKISNITGGYELAKVPEERAIFLQGTYTGMARYKRGTNGQWQVDRLAGIDFPVKQLCFESPNIIWAAHAYKGLYRMTVNDAYDRIMEKQVMTALPNTYNVKLFKIESQIIVQSGGIWHKYDPILGKLTVFEEFRPYENMSLIHYHAGHFWFVDREKSKELVYTDLKKDSLAITEPLLDERLVPDAENMVRANDSVYLLTLVDGFGSIDRTQLAQHNKKNGIPAPRLSFVKDEKQRYPLGESSFYIPYKNAQDITLQFISPEMDRPKFHFVLQGPENKTAYIPNGTLNFQNLPFGNYELAVATVGIDNTLSPVKKVAFEIAPPWYFSIWSIIFYGIVLVGAILLIRWYNRRKLKRKQRALMAKLHLEQEERLAALEKEKLEKEVKQKQRELTRTTLNVAKKNELILELKDMLTLNKTSLTNQQRYRSLTKKLNTSLDEDEDWKHFEMNFKELHGDFFENLLAKYPKLTPKDLKLCAYLKMNLSSKEIAPLMGISVRGVELHRYRLRKKLDMDGSQNLNRFLIRFN